ncbi:MAG: isopeptide-forming domain-containing fimbrial protein [Atopobiaceae bacterium]
MKSMKKVLQSIVAAVATVAMALVLIPTGALAADTSYTLTLTGTTTGHTYEAYQVFYGDLNGDTLSNVKWGTGVDATKKVDNKTLIDALKSDTTLGEKFANVTDAASVAEALSSAQNDGAVAKEFATVVSQYLSSSKASQESAADSTVIKGLSAGYYLVKDQDNSLDSTKKDAYTRFILKVVANTSAAVKSDVPTVEKKVKDTNDSKADSTTGWQDSADYDINDWVPYQITGTMPSNIADYTTYKYVFTDTMSKGLTYDKDDDDHKATIKIGDADVTQYFTENVTTNDDGSTTVTWTCNDLKKAGVTLTADTKVVVNYFAKLNSNAVIGSAGNPNEVDLTFSNNPNKGGEGNTGKTPKDKNIVFTYKATVNKVDQDNKALAGAAFTLQKFDAKQNKYVDVKTVSADDAKAVGDSDVKNSFEFTGLDDGDYKLSETTTPAGYNTISPIEFTISATHDVTSDDPKLLTLSGDVTSGTATFTADTSAGSLTTNVVNKKGSVLPSTGGMGTTVLYVVGAAIVVAAGLGLAKRHSDRTNA